MSFGEFSGFASARDSDIQDSPMIDDDFLRDLLAENTTPGILYSIAHSGLNDKIPMVTDGKSYDSTGVTIDSACVGNIVELSVSANPVSSDIMMDIESDSDESISCFVEKHCDPDTVYTNLRNCDSNKVDAKGQQVLMVQDAPPESVESAQLRRDACDSLARQMENYRYRDHVCQMLGKDDIPESLERYELLIGPDVGEATGALCYASVPKDGPMPWLEEDHVKAVQSRLDNIRIYSPSATGTLELALNKKVWTSSSFYLKTHYEAIISGNERPYFKPISGMGKKERYLEPPYPSNREWEPRFMIDNENDPAQQVLKILHFAKFTQELIITRLFTGGISVVNNHVFRIHQFCLDLLEKNKFIIEYDGIIKDAKLFYDNLGYVSYTDYYCVPSDMERESYEWRAALTSSNQSLFVLEAKIVAR